MPDPDPKRPEESRRPESMTQPLWATVGLVVSTLAGIAGIVIIRLHTQEVSAGLIAITTALVTALAMASGRRRF